MLFHIDRLSDKFYTLGFESLTHSSRRGKMHFSGKLAVSIDYAVTRYFITAFNGIKCISYHARCRTRSQRGGYMPVSGYFTGRYLHGNRINANIEIGNFSGFRTKNIVCHRCILFELEFITETD